MSAEDVPTSGAGLAGRVALVTGGAKRLGRAIVAGLAAEGATVVVHHHKGGEAAEELVRSIRRGGGRAHPLRADLSRPPEVERLLERASSLAGEVSVLVNNASIFPSGGLSQLSTQQLHRCIQLNAWAPLILTRALGLRGIWGQVVNLLDTRVAATEDPEHMAYFLSKRALADVTRMLALELAPLVRVNGVAPGAVLAPEIAPPHHMERLAEGLPLHRAGAPEDVVRAVLFLLGSPFVTGQIIYVDGGQHLQGSRA